MLKKWNEKWFKRWSIRREKGQLHYVLSQTAITVFFLIIGLFLHTLLFSNQSKWDVFLPNTAKYALFWFVMGLIVNYFGWIFAEIRYQNVIKKQKEENGNH